MNIIKFIFKFICCIFLFTLIIALIRDMHQHKKTHYYEITHNNIIHTTNEYNIINDYCIRFRPLQSQELVVLCGNLQIIEKEKIK